jgi:hypothetical protein
MRVNSSKRRPARHTPTPTPAAPQGDPRAAVLSSVTDEKVRRWLERLLYGDDSPKKT